ncbi:MAG: hypothetical protein EBR82_31560 [Caulobacteraceae bacterium]|nr:hypothetical protein [Caulobacteraceae bacterium]
MNDKPPNQGEGQPSHQAAKVVIPFDIDMSEVESKLAEIERRFEKLNGSNDRQDIDKDVDSKKEHDQPDQITPKTDTSIKHDQPDQITPKADIADKFERTIDKFDRIVESSSRQSRSDYATSFSASGIEQSQTEMLATLARMADLLRQLNDTVLLIYTDLSNRS